MRREVIRLLAPLDAIPVENELATSKTIGQPDVDIANGAIELKWLPKWPVRATTVVNIPHYSDAQRRWLLRRQTAGEWTWLMLQVKQEWFIWEAIGAQAVGALTRVELTETAKACGYFPKKPTSEQLCAVFRRTRFDY
jgi:hypothetical protein